MQFLEDDKFGVIRVGSYAELQKDRVMKKLLTEDQLNNLTTQRLLKYRDTLHRCHDHPRYEQIGDIETYEFTKDKEEWGEHHTLVKSILDKREHVR